MKLSQKGKNSAVLMDVFEYESIIDKLGLLRDIQTAKSQIENGEGIEHSEVKK